MYYSNLNPWQKERDGIYKYIIGQYECTSSSTGRIQFEDISTTYDKHQIKNVIFNNPATIVFWNDGTKTVVKCDDHDIFDPEKGLAMAISKKHFGNIGHYYEAFKKWLPEDHEEQMMNACSRKFYDKWLTALANQMNRVYVLPTEFINNDCFNCLYENEPLNGPHCDECGEGPMDDHFVPKSDCDPK